MKDRRQFLKACGAGATVAGVPAILAGCGVLPVVTAPATPPENRFLDRFGVDRPQLARVMSELTARGADWAELYFQQRRTHHLQLENGEARLPQAAVDQGVGLRVIANGQVGFAFTEDLSIDAMLAAARDAASVAAGTPAPSLPPFYALGGSNFYPVVLQWPEIALDQRRAVIARLDQQVRARGTEINTVSIDWQDADEHVLIATLDGQLITDRRPLTRLSVQVDAKRGNEIQSGFASTSARATLNWYSDERVRKLADDAVDRALIRFEARQPPLGDMPVVLGAGASGIVLHEALGHALEADFNEDAAGPYAGRVGEAVASPSITLIDDATMIHQRGAQNVDDEGTSGQQNILIEKGVLRGYLHDRMSAARFGVASTGSGRRESFRFSPMPRMTCTRIADGDATRDELLASVRRGIWAKTFSDGRVDPVSGDFSFNISTGWLLENGRATMPVRDVRLSGNGPDMLQRVTRLANDARMDEAGWTCGKRGQRVPVSHGMPSMLISSLAISA